VRCFETSPVELARNEDAMPELTQEINSLIEQYQSESLSAAEFTHATAVLYGQYRDDIADELNPEDWTKYGVPQY
jgi:hypothetical protein